MLKSREARETKRKLNVFLVIEIAIIILLLIGKEGKLVDNKK